MPIPKKGSIPGRTASRKTTSDIGLGDLLGGVSGPLDGLLKGVGKTVEGIQNLNLEDLEKLADAQGNEEAKKNIKELREKLGKLEEKGIKLGDLFGEGFDLSKLIKFATEHGGEFSKEFAGGRGIIRGGLRGHVLGIPLGGKDLPLERRGSQETKFDVKGTRFKKTTEQEIRPEKFEIQEPEIEIYYEGNYIKTVGEMPGVEEKNIKCEVKEEGRVLRISAEGRKKYKKEISLPAAVSQKVSWRYQNGILEITLIKKGGD